MKPSYSDFEARKTSSGYTELPPVGAYVAEIQDVRFVPKGDNANRDRIELFMEIVEGEYRNRFHDVYAEQNERFGSATYRGIFRLLPPVPNEQWYDLMKQNFEGNLWCVQESNPGYRWDWDEKKLKGKKVGISLRKRLYTYNGKDKEAIEIGQFETIDDVRNGKCKPMKVRDQREKRSEPAETDGSGFTEVSGSEVSVPWN